MTEEAGTNSRLGPPAPGRGAEIGGNNGVRSDASDEEVGGSKALPRKQRIANLILISM